MILGGPCLTNLVVLAADQAAGGGSAFGWLSILTLWVPIILLFYWLLIRPQRQEQAKRQAMLAALKKNDRVIAAGGIYGVVADIDREANRVTVKVDETTNTRLRVTLSSVIPILQDEPSDEKASSK
jgi:preprotein translocase subunit YajC